jgi:hypothetical protein
MIHFGRFLVGAGSGLLRFCTACGTPTHDPIDATDPQFMLALEKMSDVLSPAR